ncbi:MAG TPA: amidohydrolase family protein, partial [Dehalococcoidia bacterium]|nr:amidohydrolase family protein [Dehalococcoidia bacterium]
RGPGHPGGRIRQREAAAGLRADATAVRGPHRSAVDAAPIAPAAAACYGGRVRPKLRLLVAGDEGRPEEGCGIMLDLVIRGGQVVTPQGAGQWDVAIQGERIAAVALPGSLTEDIGRVIDATGKIVVPGGIDPHIHASFPWPDPLGGPVTYSAGPRQVSRAALYGGTTTLIDFAVRRSRDTLQDALERRNHEYLGESFCDYAYHLMLLRSVPYDILDQFAEAIQAGHTSVKMFTTDVTPVPSGRGPKLNFGEIWEVLQRLARHGGIAAIHSEDDELVMHQYEKLRREERVGFENLAEVHSTMSEDLGFRRILRLAEHVEGAALYMMHVSAATGVRAIAEARSKGLPIYGETLHQYALFTSEDYKRPNGQIYHTYPSLKGPEDHVALWGGMADGPIGSVATDELCSTLEMKTRGKNIDDCYGGNSGVEPRMGVIYTEAVVRRGFSLERYADITSTHAAKVFGLYPRKGALAAGSDADIAILDPTVRRTLRKEDLHETDYSPWEGWEIRGWPVTTLLRGQVVVENGELKVDSPAGRWVPRKVADAVLSRPAC